MDKIARWSVEHRVTANLLMVFVVALGLMALSSMKREMFPNFSLDMISIQVEYLGASPEEIEEGIVVKIEEKIKSIDGIKRIVSTCNENFGSILIELREDVEDTQKVVDEVQTQVDTIDTFPEEAEEPVIMEVTIRDEAINLAVYGDASERTLRRIAEKVRDDLSAYPAISQVNLTGVRDYEISVEVSEEALRRYGLTFDAVTAAVRAGSLDLPGGVIKTSGGEVLVRSKGQRYIGSEFEKIPLITLPEGTIVTLGDVATVVDAFEDSDIRGRFNGKPAALIQVRKTKAEDILDITNTVRNYVEENEGSLPPGVKIGYWADFSTLVKDRIDLLIRNGIQGIILVFISLALFLRISLAFWVALGIPVSFMAAFFVLQEIGASINMISLFAFIMTLGILVDDAIVIGENVYAHYERGEPPLQAIIEGTKEVGWPVIMSVSTTIVAFMPLLFVSGIMGKFMKILPTAVIAILIVSLWEAFFILPAHLAESLEYDTRKKRAKKRFHTRMLDSMQRGLRFTIERIYGPLLSWVVRNRYFTLSVAIAVLIVMTGFVAGGRIPFVLFPRPDSNYLQAEINFPLGTPVSVTENAVERVEAAIPKLNEEFRGPQTDGKDIVRYSFSLVGVYATREGYGKVELGGHLGQVFLEILDPEYRDISSTEVVNRWRDLVGEIPGAEKLAFSTIGGGPGGNPVEVQLIGNDFDTLQSAADDLKAELAKFPGVFDITDNFRPGKLEIKLNIKQAARPLGVTLADLARQVRQAFYGDEAVRIQRGRDDVKVMVRYSEKERRTLGSIEDMRIRTPGGAEVPFSEVAEVEYGRGYSVINRIDRERQITVTADVDEATANAAVINRELKNDYLPGLVKQYPGVRYTFEGEEQRTYESVSSLIRGFSIAILAMYLLLATQFRSYIQPVIIMTAIPFGFIGAILGHALMGMPITLLSLFGVVALAGIVINDSIILIDFINRAVEEGVPLFEAVEQSGKARFRAVILTSLTTIAGLLPLLLERSFQAQFLIPMATSIAFGLLVATALTLLFVPTLYLIVWEANKALRLFFGLPPKPEREAQSAG